MKNWSKHWKKSKKPRKQHKYTANAPPHIKSKMIKSHLSKELRQKYSARSARVIKGDKIKIMKGNFSGKTGIVERINVSSGKAYIQGIELTKKEGGKAQIPQHTSNLLIIELNLKDKKRFKNKGKDENGKKTL